MSDAPNAAMLEARAKLQAKFESRIGGKGTVRRKVKAKNTGVVVNDDKKMQANFKKMGLNQIPGIEEVNLFTDTNEIIHFKEPKVHASLQANTYAISGTAEHKSLQEMLPKVISQLGSENLKSLRKVMEQMPTDKAGASKDAVEDDIPDLGEANFEDVSKDVEVD